MAFPTLSPAGPSLGRVRRSVVREINDWPVARVRNCRIGSRSWRCDRIGGSSGVGCCCDCCGGVGADAEECEAGLEEAAHDDVAVLAQALILARCRAKCCNKRPGLLLKASFSASQKGVSSCLMRK